MTSVEAVKVCDTQKYSPEEIEAVINKLKEPFDPECLSIRPQSVDWNDNAQVLWYADVREYHDRLNQVVGYDGWFSIVTQNSVSGFETVKTLKEQIQEGDPDFDKNGESYQDRNTGERKFKRQFREKKFNIPTAKVLVTVGVGIIGIGYQENVGESPATDENAYTVAYAQAFKRACANFGLGRYLYDVPKITHPYDKKKNCFKDPQPQIPEEFLPKYFCEETGVQIVPITVNGKVYSVREIIRRSRENYGRILAPEIQKKRREEANQNGGNRLQ